MVLAGLGKRASCGSFGQFDHPACLGRHPAAKGGMRPHVVVAVSPESHLSARVGQAVEDLLVEAFVAQAAVEAFDGAVLLRLAGIDVMLLDAAVLGPLQDRPAGELGAVHDGSSRWAAGAHDLSGVGAAGVVTDDGSLCGGCSRIDPTYVRVGPESVCLGHQCLTDPDSSGGGPFDKAVHLAA